MKAQNKPLIKLIHIHRIVGFYRSLSDINKYNNHKACHRDPVLLEPFPEGLRAEADCRPLYAADLVRNARRRQAASRRRHRAGALVLYVRSLPDA